MVRTGEKAKLLEAMQHAKKYLSPYIDSQSKEILRAAGLLAFRQNTQDEPYKVCNTPPYLPFFPANKYSLFTLL
jgi:macrophage erythroblast attacher